MDTYFPTHPDYQFRSRADVSEEKVEECQRGRGHEAERLNDLACDSSTTARRWGWVAFNLIRIEKELSAMLRKDNSLALPLDDEQRAVVRKAREAVSGLGYGAVAEQKKHEAVAESYRTKGKERS